MHESRQRKGFWRSVRDLPDRTPLRTKLIAAVLALVIVALGVVSFAGVSYVRGYLLGRADTELQSMQTRASGGYGRSTGNFGPQVGERTISEAITSSGQRFPAQFSQLSSTDPKIPSTQSWLAANADRPVTVSSLTGSDKWRVIVTPHQQFSLSDQQTFTGTLVVGIDVTDIYATVSRLEAFDLFLCGLIVLLLALVATAAVRASLRPLNEIEETAGAIAAGDLSRRVPERDPRTEVGSLGRSLNVMLSQIEYAFRARSRSEAAARRSEEKMRQFVADASHELRTPLTAIRGFAEYYRQRGGVGTGHPAAIEAGEVVAGLPRTNGKGQLAPADLDRIMRRVEQESARMGVLVEDMLLLARLDQQRPLDRHPVDLLTLAADAVHDARVVAPSRNINLSVGAGAALLVIGDEVRLRQVIGNLMSNALAHTPEGSPIEVLIRAGSLDEAPVASGTAIEAAEPDRPDRPDNASEFDYEPAADWAQPTPPPPGQAAERPAVVLEVTDHGPGLTREQAAHVFERFYRADPARTSKGGTGLGLAIVAALVGAHGGTAWVRSRPGSGATFCIALPLAPEAILDSGLRADDETDDTDDEPGWIGGPAHGNAA
jgi:two-component system, OmpR family, sensor kinase